jgi:hypothetical protein
MIDERVALRHSWLFSQEERPPGGGLSVSTVVIRPWKKSVVGQTASGGCSTAGIDATGPNDLTVIPLDIGSPPFVLVEPETTSPPIGGCVKSPLCPNASAGVCSSSALL